MKTPPKPSKPTARQDNRKLRADAPPAAPRTTYGKLPPQALELEEAVLGTILLERDKLADVLRIIRTPDAFYADAHQKIFQSILTLEAKGSPVDLLTVTDALRRSGELAQVGDAYYLTQLTMNVVSSGNVERHAKLVMEKFMSREIIRTCSDALAAAYEDGADVFDQLDKVQLDISAINDNIRQGNIKSFGSAFVKTLEAMEAARLRTGEILGLATHLTRFNKITDGLNAPDLITMAGGTGEGKTTMALNMAEHIAAAGTPVGFFSLEMHDRQLIWKVLSKHINEDVRTIRKGGFSEEKWNALRTNRHFSKLPLYIYDRGGINILELKATARTMVKKYGVKVLFIDYLQLIRGAGKGFGTREQEVNMVSKELKALAMELDIPIIALSQLNRIEKTNAGRMYRLSDLRESGAIEQDSDGVVFIFRPTEHGQTEMNIGGEQMRFEEKDALIYIAKWRLGETGTFRVQFDGKYNRFTDYEYDPFSRQQEQPAYSPGIVAASPQASGYQAPRGDDHSTNFSLGPGEEDPNLPF